MINIVYNKNNILDSCTYTYYTYNIRIQRIYNVMCFTKRRILYCRRIM